ncbi:hypothetical protein J6590_083964 [Homalodisca vitripennis]|nr:hypothetical protein J6590_083964 [Homalodisca vitripennis]
MKLHFYILPDEFYGGGSLLDIKANINNNSVELTDTELCNNIYTGSHDLIACSSTLGTAISCGKIRVNDQKD